MNWSNYTLKQRLEEFEWIAAIIASLTILFGGPLVGILCAILAEVLQSSIPKDIFLGYLGFTLILAFMTFLIGFIVDYIRDKK